MKRWTKVFSAIGSLIVLVLMFVWLTGNFSCEGKIPPGTTEVKEESAAGLKTLKISSTVVPIEIEAVGTVSARRTAEVSSKIMATVTGVMASAGDTVKKGQTLFVLDSRDAEARLAQAREALASAKAAREQADLEAARIERLFEKEAATKQQQEQTRASLKMASASAEAAKAMVREAEVMLSYTRIDSPIAGIVIDRMIDPGDMAAPGKPMLTTYDPSSLRLEVSVGEHLRPKVLLGSTVRASVGHPGIEFEGRVEEIVPASDAASRTFIARVSIPSAESAYPGMYGRIWLQTGTAETILIPPEAVRNVGQVEMVTVVESGLARTRTVKIGKTYPEGVEILSGLGPGELVALP